MYNVKWKEIKEIEIVLQMNFFNFKETQVTEMTIERQNLRDIAQICVRICIYKKKKKKKRKREAKIVRDARGVYIGNGYASKTDRQYVT